MSMMCSMQGCEKKGWNVRARKNDARHDGHGGGRRGSLLAVGMTGASHKRPRPESAGDCKLPHSGQAASAVTYRNKE